MREHRGGVGDLCLESKNCSASSLAPLARGVQVEGRLGARLAPTWTWDLELGPP